MVQGHMMINVLLWLQM